MNKQEHTITPELVEKLTHNVTVLGLLIDNIEATYMKLVNDKIQEEEIKIPVGFDNVYHINPSIMASMEYLYKNKTVMHVDAIVEQYVDWMTSVSSMIMLNIKHYKKNKAIKGQIDNLVEIMLPNSKSMLKKGEDFLVRAVKYLEEVDKLNNLKKAISDTKKEARNNEASGYYVDDSE